jgi:hypothetical protein
MVFFAGVTLVQSSLLADCYISRDLDERGRVVRNKSYVDAVKLYLGDHSYVPCSNFFVYSTLTKQKLFTFPVVRLVNL